MHCKGPLRLCWINYTKCGLSLSFTAQEGRGAGIIQQIQDIVAQPTTSEDYKAALQRKLQ